MLIPLLAALVVSTTPEEAPAPSPLYGGAALSFGALTDGISYPTTVLSGTVGGRVNDALGFGAMLDASLSMLGTMPIGTVTLGPSLRVGRTHSLDVALGPTLLVRQAGLVPSASLVVRGSLKLTERWALTAEAATILAAHLASNAPPFFTRLGVGVGVSF